MGFLLALCPRNGRNGNTPVGCWGASADACVVFVWLLCSFFFCGDGFHVSSVDPFGFPFNPQKQVAI